ncbi:MAG: sensor histidine kinase [Acidimicrobiia bacterium]
MAAPVPRPDAGDWEMTGLSGLKAEDPEQVARDLFTWSERLVGIDGAFLFVHQEDDLVAVHSFEVPGDRLGPLRVPVRGGGPIEQAFAQGVTQVISGDVAFEWASDAMPKWSTTVCVPLVIEGRAIGVYAAGWTASYDIRRETVLVLEGAAAMAASAMHRARLLHDVKREEQRLRLLLDRLPIPAIAFSIPGLVVTQVNAEGRRLLGDIEGRATWDVLTERGAGPFDGSEITREQAMFGMLSGEQARGRIRLTSIEGSTRVMSPRIARLGATGGVITLVDVTSDANLEAQRHRFVRMVSHHLRTPLTPLLGFAELMMESQHTDPAMRRAAADMSAAVQEITGHVQRLEQISDLQPVGSHDMAAIDVGSLVAKAWSEADGNPEDLVIEGELSLLAMCEPDHVTRSMAEVFKNAYDHGRPPVRVSVSLASAGVTVTIRDSGPGISNEWASTVFAPYLTTQDGYLAPAVGHPGLGLTLARGLMEATHGDLNYLDGRFVFTIPPGETPAGPAASPLGVITGDALGSESGTDGGPART